MLQEEHRGFSFKDGGDGVLAPDQTSTGTIFASSVSDSVDAARASRLEWATRQ